MSEAVTIDRIIKVGRSWHVPGDYLSASAVRTAHVNAREALAREKRLSESELSVEVMFCVSRVKAKELAARNAKNMAVIREKYGLELVDEIDTLHRLWALYLGKAPATEDITYRREDALTRCGVELPL